MSISSIPVSSNAWEIAARMMVSRCQRLTELATPSLSEPAPAPPDGADRLVQLLSVLPDSIGYLQFRRSEPFAKVESEADFQDLIYLGLKPTIRDLQYEVPTNKSSFGFSVGDFYVPSSKLIIEAKYIGKRSHVRRVAAEIAEDIWKYASQTPCEGIIFAVLDRLMLIPDRPQFIAGATAERGAFTVEQRAITIETVIVPD